ncbi:hypothetical protein [Agromyces bracchium]|uniref:Mucin-associated surface protein n=1 Tax=Agromyces bracchium TaxID=88376 RepID=A0A6I3MGF4_9MICO|nr:hypothetical protein [Agromyces bracchium]MTH70456.1 hypothetical protein [Agromyces bracchium]
MTSRLRRAVAAASVTIALAAGLAGCATAQDDAGQATGFRTQVVSIAESSAAGDFADALARLDALQAEVDAALADGTLDADRAASITEAIALVRADLDAAIAAATPTPSPTPTDASDDDGDETEDEADDSGPGNADDKPGKGKGRDKGGDD